MRRRIIIFGVMDKIHSKLRNGHRVMDERRVLSKVKLRLFCVAAECFWPSTYIHGEQKRRIKKLNKRKATVHHSESKASSHKLEEKREEEVHPSIPR